MVVVKPSSELRLISFAHAVIVSPKLLSLEVVWKNGS
jgi:hypothetical protein